ncbi:unnamed protein product, partial [Medioppia subpectinata]
MSEIRKSTVLKALNYSISNVSPRAIIFTMFVVYVLSSGHLGAESVFVTISVFNALQFTMTYAFPQSVVLASELYVSCLRIQKYLLLEEIQDQPSVTDGDINGKNNINNNDKDFSVCVKHMSAAWDPTLHVPTLSDISVELAPGELLVVVGPVGSGKTSFLMSLLDEIEVTGGHRRVRGRVSYAAQESWAFNTSIAQNVTFGQPLDPKRFREVMGVCALDTDLRRLPFAEKTLVGERGVTLSGGQRARITLARYVWVGSASEPHFSIRVFRALYTDADVYLLDEPLSSVDTEVANHIFDKCITEYLANKTVILVTHQIQHLERASKILVLNEGRLVAVGPYNQLSTVLKALNYSISNVSPRAIIFTMFVVYVLSSGHLGAESVFVTISVFNALQFTMTYAFPQSVVLASELYVSCLRIQKYLLLEEIQDQPSVTDGDINGKNNINNNDKDFSVCVKHMSAAWDPTLHVPTLSDISVELAPGELLVVVGPVGSGKTSFLMSLLDEIEVTGGHRRVRGRVSYAAQESWAFNTSIAQNVTFGQPLDPKRFREVMGVCALDTDLRRLPFAEKTLVGERGVTLSGGQRARITLARYVWVGSASEPHFSIRVFRALYTDADVYLLDEPLSSVDTEVANHIFDKCITEYLANKTVILVTHQIQHLERASKILVLNEGRLVAVGPYNQLVSSGVDFLSIIKEKRPDGNVVIDREPMVMKRSESLTSVHSKTAAEEIGDQKVDDETKATGGVSGRVYWHYVKAGAGPALLTMCLSSMIASQGLQYYTDVWLSQ